MTSYELPKKLSKGSDLIITFPSKKSHPNLKYAEGIRNAVIGSSIYLTGESDIEWVKNMNAEWGKEKVMF
jgi:hypothetical protein